MLIHYANRSVELNGTYLFFGNSHTPYSAEPLSAGHTGYACLFTEELVRATDHSENLHQSSLLKVGGTPAFLRTAEQAPFLTGIFQKMLAELA